MSGTGYRKKWLRSGKVLDYYIDGGPWAATFQDAEYQIYNAVMDGEIRARIDGKPFDDFQELRKKKWSDSSLYALPFDLELNLEDVERIWDWSKYDLADLLARRVVSPASAEMRMETNNLNLRVLLERVRVRLSAMHLAAALEETEFEKRWTGLVREQNLYIGSKLINLERLPSLLAEYAQCKLVKERYIDAPLKAPINQAPRGRKPAYNWDAAFIHIADQFAHHGPLSPDDPEWSCQADVEREIQRFFAKTIGREPALSTTRERAKAIIEKLMADKSRP